MNVDGGSETLFAGMGVFGTPVANDADEIRYVRRSWA